MTYIVTKSDGIRLPQEGNPAGRFVPHGGTFEAAELGDLDEARRARILRVMVEHRRIAECDGPRSQITKSQAGTKTRPVTPESTLIYHPVGRYELPDGRIIKGKQAALDALAG